MILRVIALLLALPVQAQEFSGLVPGMPVSVLVRQDEAFLIREIDGNGGNVTFPLQNQRGWLRVFHDGQTIDSITIGAPFGRPRPAEGRLELFHSTISDVRDIAGSGGWYFDTEGQFLVGPHFTEWYHYYDLPNHPDVVLRLLLADSDMEMEPFQNALGQHVTNPRAVLQTISLYHRDFLTDRVDYFGTSRIDHPDAAPFALPLAEAFPLTELP